MLGRCHNPNRPNYQDYGGRGITVCDRWRTDFAAFLADMGRKPSPQHSLNRLDNDKGYSPDNCRWASPYEQSINRRSTIMVGGIPFIALVRKHGIKFQKLRYRLQAGWSLEDALTISDGRKR